MKEKSFWAAGLMILLALGSYLYKNILFGDNFYKVDSVHDFFEIIGAAATTVAVIVAAVSLGSWRKQAKAAIDHDIAKSLMISLSKFQDVTLICWSRAQRFMEYRQQYSQGSHFEHNFMVSYYEEGLKDAKLCRDELEGVVLEAEILWGDFLGLDLYRLYGIQDSCCRVLEYAVMTGKHEGEASALLSIPSYAEKEWNKLVEIDMCDFSTAYSHIKAIAKPLVGEARKKLLRL